MASAPLTIPPLALLLLGACTSAPQLGDSTTPFGTPAEPTERDGGQAASADAGTSPNQTDGGQHLPPSADAGFSVAPVADSCQTFMDCLLAIDPDTPLDPEFLGAFGEGGTCWVNGQNIAAFCDSQCIQQLVDFQEVADFIPECAYDFGPGFFDAGSPDAGELGAGALDAGLFDAGDLNAGDLDAGSFDASGIDSGASDAG